MPRPKRSRVAPARAAAIEKQQASKAPPPTGQPVAPEVPENNIYDLSDEEKQRGKARAQQARILEVNSEQADALNHAKAQMDEAMGGLDNLTSTSKPADEDSESPNIEYSRRDSVSVAAASRAPRLTDASGLDLDDDMMFNLDDSLDDSQAIDDTQSGHYSRATDTSSFNVAAFRRRPRQSSIVGKDDAPIRPSSRGQNTPSITSHLNLGKFKRRQREPSILGTNRKESAQRPQSQMSNYGSVIGDDDSGPEDQSTPLDKTKRHSAAAKEVPESREGSPSLPTRKRKSLEEQTGREKRQALVPESASGDESSELSDLDLPLGGAGLTHSLPESEMIHQSIEVDSTPPGSPPGRQTPELDDPDMAPPASSSSSIATSPVAFPSLDNLAHRIYHRKPAREKTPELDDGPSDCSSPPSLTHSPNYGTARTRAKAKPKPAKKSPPKVTTADLEHLLPARRKRKAAGAATEATDDPFDIESSEDDHYGDDADELSFRGTRKAQPRKRQAALAQSKGRNAKAAEAEKNKKKGRRYGAKDSDKENAEDDGEEEEVEEGQGVTLELGSEAGEQAGDESVWDAEKSALMEAQLGTELKNAAKKFKEVDRWELSFEEVTASSSPVPDAR